MAEKAPNLDDLRFQKDLVDVARKRIQDYCPEWTDYNLSDPGITLIELFAWMTENIIYRLNRVPEKNYRKFLEMIGITPKPGTGAKAELNFYLSAPLPIDDRKDLVVKIEKEMRVAAPPTETEEEITFMVDKEVVISAPPMLTDFRKSADHWKENFQPRLSRGGHDQIAVFPPKPAPEDAFAIGFAETQDVAGYLLKLTFDCVYAAGVLVRVDNPPWMWECSLGDGQWETIPVSKRRGEEDTTGGLNREHGSLVLQLPQTIRPDYLGETRAYWIRCRLLRPDADQTMYDASPQVQFVEAQTLGAAIMATQASIVRTEFLGLSNGEAGQSFQVKYAPILRAMTDKESEEEISENTVVEVEEKVGESLNFTPWKRVGSFADSNRYDRHFQIDDITGEVQFGPAIRQPDGSIRQYGRVPDAGRKVQIREYHYGGGSRGNVPAEKICMMYSSVPLIDYVTNLKPATGGRDPENIDEVKMRARRELRSQHRAVTGEDFELLGKAAEPDKIARVKCISGTPGQVDLLVVPFVNGPMIGKEIDQLALPDTLVAKIEQHLQPLCLLCTQLSLRAPSYIGVQIKATITVDRPDQEKFIQERVKRVLSLYLSPFPLKPDSRLRVQEDLKSFSDEDPQDEWLLPEWQGWPFGRPVIYTEFFAFLMKIRGVRQVSNVAIYRTEPIQPQVESTQDGKNASAVFPLTRILDGQLLLSEDTMLFSLDHEIQVKKP
jgi:predicted phage baseplate assembly protein